VIRRVYRRAQHVATMISITPLLYIFEALTVSKPSGVGDDFWQWIWDSMWEDLDR